MIKKQKHSTVFINDVLAIIEDNKNEYGKWNKVVEAVKAKYPKVYVTIDVVRHIYRTYSNEVPNPVVTKDKLKDELVGLTSLEDRLLNKIKKKSDLKVLARLLNVGEDEIYTAVAKLQAKGYNAKVWVEGGITFVQNFKKEFVQHQDLDLRIEGAREITFAIISDQHFTSEYCDEEALNNFYDLCEARGIKSVFAAGDLVEGFKPTRFSTFLGNKAIGFQAQLEYTVKNYPRRKGVTTYSISGNHTNWYLNDGMANIDKTISMLRDDIKYLGHDFARVWLTDKVDLTLYHPNDGSSRAVFTKLQNFIERGGDKVSKINVVGHYHKVGMLKHNGVFGYYPASFQRQSEWMNLNNLKSYVGGWIVTIKVDENGELLNLISEYIDYDLDDK